MPWAGFADKLMKYESDQAVHDAFPVVVELPVVWGEMDSMRHVNNTGPHPLDGDLPVCIFDRIQLRESGEATGRSGILKSVECNFRVPPTAPDRILVGGKVVELGSDFFVMQHVIFSINHQKVAAHGSSVVVGFDYQTRRKAIFLAVLPAKSNRWSNPGIAVWLPVA
ncbi:MAG: thioesterase [Pseudomonadota bacterium]|nr:MAG: thioesterase [Pseudomonadota bacterium]